MKSRLLNRCLVVLLIACHCFCLTSNNSALWAADDITSLNSRDTTSLNSRKTSPLNNQDMPFLNSHSNNDSKIINGKNQTIKANTTHSAHYHYPRPSFKI